MQLLQLRFGASCWSERSRLEQLHFVPFLKRKVYRRCWWNDVKRTGLVDTCVRILVACLYFFLYEETTSVLPNQCATEFSKLTVYLNKSWWRLLSRWNIYSVNIPASASMLQNFFRYILKTSLLNLLQLTSHASYKYDRQGCFYWKKVAKCAAAKKTSWEALLYSIAWREPEHAVVFRHFRHRQNHKFNEQNASTIFKTRISSLWRGGTSSKIADQAIRVFLG